MDARIALLRGINLGPSKRIAMADLRAAFADAGIEDARTYLQSGNVVFSSKAAPATLAKRCERLIASRFGFEVPVVIRTREELAAVIERNPLRDVATDPKRYQVSFLDGELDPAVLERLQAQVAPGEALVAHGRELYAWHPAGVARSKLWGGLAGPGLGTKATARNWTTVTSVLELADGLR